MKEKAPWKLQIENASAYFYYFIVTDPSNISFLIFHFELFKH